MAREMYYLVQKISTATKRNLNFAGEVHVLICGKNDFTLFYDTPDGWNNCNRLSPYYVREHGYKRRCDAVRNWTYKNPNVDAPKWESDVRIVRAWVRCDNKVYVEA